MENQYYGACRFCGQMSTTKPQGLKNHTQLDELATMVCNCAGAQKYKAEKKAEQERKQDLIRTENQIKKLFGTGAESFGVQQVESEILPLLMKIATFVYDGYIKDACININANIKTKISRSGKSKLSITRSDASTFKQEV